MPSEAQCQLRQRLQRKISQTGIKDAGLWSVDAQELNLMMCIQDVADQIPSALELFKRLADKSEVLNTVLNQEKNMSALWGFGNKPSPIHSYLTGHLALAEGDRELARTKLQKAVQSNCFISVFADVDGAIKLITGVS